MVRVRVVVDGVEYEVEVEELSGGTFRAGFNEKTHGVQAGEAAQTPSPAPSTPRAPVAPTTGGNVVAAPMPGKILRLLVGEGERVKAGQDLLLMEAMKMENEVSCLKDGVVKRILVREGDTVDTGQALIELDAVQ
ncbi:biotin/lipoyl-containing protein [Thermococcus sp.]|uniref:biotin/lipoyl-containing protein n=1 Tax=Thermococcus sp. TaxID=35749 RepID=UPI0025F0742A|nr:biotin/lipoyl-containing protein [Thermococcus sp.]